MRSRLEIEVNKFQLQYRISGLSLFNDWLQLYMGIDSKESSLGANYRYEGDDEEDVYVYIAKDLSLEDLRKVLAVLDIPEADYRTKKDISIPNTLMMETLFPEFKRFVEKMAKENPSSLKIYQLESKPALEDNAVRNIRKACVEIIKALADSDELNEQTTYLLQMAYCIKGILEEKQDKIEKLIPLGKRMYLEYCRTYSIDSVSALTASLQSLGAEIENYEVFNQAELRRITEKFLPEVEAFMKPYRISIGQCDFLEDMLLKMAGISQASTKSSIERSISDKTRFLITMRNLPQEAVEKFLAFFKEFGDDSAYIGAKRKRVKIMNEMVPQCASIKIDGGDIPKDKVDKFNVDGVVLYQTILPQFKNFVREIAEPEQFAKYQEASIKVFGKIAAQKVSGVTLEKVDTLFRKSTGKTENQQDRSANLLLDLKANPTPIHRLG